MSDLSAIEWSVLGLSSVSSRTWRRIEMLYVCIFLKKGEVNFKIKHDIVGT